MSRAYLSRMRAEVGDAMLRRYAQAFLDLLPERLDRIDRAISAADAAEAAHVIIELQISSEMLGARRLAALLTALESSLEAGLIPSTAQLSHVRTEAGLAAPMLRAATGLDSSATDLDSLGRPDHGALGSTGAEPPKR